MIEQSKVIHVILSKLRAVFSKGYAIRARLFVLGSRLRLASATARFKISKVPFQLIHHTLRHDMVRQAVLKILSYFPNVKQFLQARFRGTQQSLDAERVVFQSFLTEEDARWKRYSIPNLIIAKNRKTSPVSPIDLALVQTKQRAIEEILKRIDKEVI